MSTKTGRFADSHFSIQEPALLITRAPYDRLGEKDYAHVKGSLSAVRWLRYAASMGPLWKSGLVEGAVEFVRRNTHVNTRLVDGARREINHPLGQRFQRHRGWLRLPPEPSRGECHEARSSWYLYRRVPLPKAVEVEVTASLLSLHAGRQSAKRR